MDSADEMNVGRQVGEDASATVQIIDRDQEGAFGKGGGEPANQLQTKLRPGAMRFGVVRRSGLLLFREGLLTFVFGSPAARVEIVLLLALVVALQVAIEPKADGQGKGFAGRPSRQAHDEAKDDPVVSPTDELDGLAGEQRIVMHAGAEEVESSFAAQGVIEGQEHNAIGSKGGEQEFGQGQAQFVEGPDGVTEETMEA